MTALDRRFVVPTWAQGAKWRGLSKHERFARVDRALDADARAYAGLPVCRVVVLASGPTVHAWAAGAGGILFFAYVPPELRGEGLGRRVITALLGGYPDVIQTIHPWPRASERFRHVQSTRMRTAA